MPVNFNRPALMTYVISVNKNTRSDILKLLSYHIIHSCHIFIISLCFHWKKFHRSHPPDLGTTLQVLPLEVIFGFYELLSGESEKEKQNIIISWWWCFLFKEMFFVLLCVCRLLCGSRGWIRSVCVNQLELSENGCFNLNNPNVCMSMFVYGSVWL